MSKKDTRISNVNAVKDQLSSVKTEVKNGVFIFTNNMTVGEFAEKVKISANAIIKNFLLKGKMIQINHVLEEEDIAEICLEHNLDFKKETSIDASNFLNTVVFEDDPKDLTKRPPVVTVMGHVDHGKTTLVDYIRKTKVAQSESSGITQHTGAYQVNHNNSLITFIDTPGHEVFTEMRSRGAKITDIIILVVAADDGIMPQTIEAIELAKQAKVPLIIFINKMDKPNKNIEKIKNQLLEHDVVIEEYKGDTPVVYGAAKIGQGVDELLSSIVLLSDLLDLKANYNRYPIGTVIESKVDTGLGVMTKIIIENGTLEKGDFIVAGSCYGRVKSISNTLNELINKATPGDPVTITGLNNLPLAGDRFIGFDDEKFAKKIAEDKAKKDKATELMNRNTQVINLDSNKKIFNVIIKSDVQGTAEAVKSTINGMSNEEAVINVVSASAGQTNNNDLLLAQSSNAIIINFNVKPSANIKQTAKQQKVTMTYYKVILKVQEDMRALLDGERKVIYEEKKIGSAHIIKLFKYSKVGIIAGSMMDEGVVKIGCKVKVFRNKKMVYQGVIETLQREKNQVKEVVNGKDFGTHIKGFNDIKQDDILEFFEDVAVPFN
ncbi:translation initiation factor IF-2 [Mycoplasma sp. Mirounga ES2805-ORL]|uniref:translation initiation factor IF-2 n=1 Tax=Mycoplasma sp. Mirounga ES2805-ORL TaxID=754514 RepID=UPI00197C3EF0|nr:translation initiation factor IF-2 [Mycoplasma sp. Mirounga ES2805-ORL]QSF13567.1 translation initiation factor IF-2 [Mycoplasma sp. Mirounga ES2805-ORL]